MAKTMSECLQEAWRNLEDGIYWLEDALAAAAEEGRGEEVRIQELVRIAENLVDEVKRITNL